MESARAKQRALARRAKRDFMVFSGDVTLRGV
jgi:hypothetical protein